MATGKCREKLIELLTFIKADVMAEPQTGILLNAEDAEEVMQDTILKFVTAPWRPASAMISASISW